MAVSLICAWLILVPQDMDWFSQSLVAVSAFASNILFWKTSGYFDVATELKPLLHTWSLAVEEQYYVFFPILLALLWKVGRRVVLPVLCLIFVGSLTLAQWGSYYKATAAFYLLPTRGWELLIGVIGSVWVFRNRHSGLAGRTSGPLGFAGLAMILISVFAYSKETPFPGVYALLPTVGTLLVILFANRETVVGRLLGHPLPVGIGLISYSAYLWHQPLFAFARHLSVDEPIPIVKIALAALALGLGYLSWRFVETPFRNKSAYSRRQIFTFAGCGIVLFITVGAAGYTTKGFEGRLPASGRDSVLFGERRLYMGAHSSDGSCVSRLHLPALAEEVCLTSADKPEILFAGDSHAMALYSSIYGKFVPADAVLVSESACQLYADLTYIPSFEHRFDNCTKVAREALRVSEQISSIKTVILANYFVSISDEKSDYWSDGRNLSEREAFIRGYDYLIDYLQKRGKRVIVVVDVPHLKYDPRICLQNMPIALPRSHECRFNIQENDLSRKDYIAEMQRLKDRHPELLIYDPTPLFCRDHFCEVARDGHSLYNDTHHVSLFASELMLRTMRNEGMISYGEKVRAATNAVTESIENVVRPTLR